MTPAVWHGQDLWQPIGPDRPCGEDLEDTHLLSSFDAFRLFGRALPFDQSEDDARRRIGQPDLPPDWGEVREKALEALRRSKDLRLLAYLGAAALRTDGLRGFCATLETAAYWLDTYWVDTYPPVDEDALLRRNALNSFADRIAVLHELQRIPLVSSRQHGAFNLREIEAAAGPAAGSTEPKPDELRLRAAFAGLSTEELTDLHGCAAGGVTALRRIAAIMNEHAGVEFVPDVEPLAAMLGRIVRLFAGELATRAPAGGAAAAAGAPAPGPAEMTAGAGSGATAVAASGVAGAIASREDAVRALDRVIEFFRRHEPSSPVPLLLERAKRLVSKDFLEVLADLAPEGMAQARAAGGLPPPES